MGKVKIKRKSTLIDMTAMSDVTVLLLTFFMLTSTFLAKEPTTVLTPSSVSEEKVPLENLVTLLISGADDAKAGEKGQGKVFMSLTGSSDSTLIPSGKLRAAVLDEAVKIYNDQRGKNLQITPAEKAVFMQLNMFGVPFSQLKTFLDPNLPQSKRDELQGNLLIAGIPYQAGDPNRNKEYLSEHNLNDLQIWFKAVKRVADDSHSDIASNDPENAATVADLKNAIKSGQAVAVKADKNTPVSVVEEVFDNLQTMQLNKFTLLTALKSEDEPTK